MGRYRIHCKIHDSLERVVQVGIDNRLYHKDTVWSWIKSGEHSFYTAEKGFEADVIAAEREGRKYLTTAPDKVTDNNLDELPKCT